MSRFRSLGRARTTRPKISSWSASAAPIPARSGDHQRLRSLDSGVSSMTLAKAVAAASGWPSSAWAMPRSFQA